MTRAYAIYALNQELRRIRFGGERTGAHGAMLMWWLDTDALLNRTHGYK